jgi:hypothetical protein
MFARCAAAHGWDALIDPGSGKTCAPSVAPCAG